MENYPIAKFEVIIKDDELAKCKDAEALRSYLLDVVSPVICSALTSAPKGGEVGASCSTDRGCEVHVGGSWRF